MRNKLKHNIFLTISSLLIISILVSSIILTSCKNGENKLYQDVTLEVFNLDTGDKIKENKTYRFEYNGSPKVFAAKVRLDETEKYLEDKDFENKDWKSHIKMYVMTEGDDAYKDWKIVDGKNVVYNWTNAEHWPTKCGVYYIQLEFNNHGFRDEVKNSNKYIKKWFNFTIVIEGENYE